MKCPHCFQLNNSRIIDTEQVFKSDTIRRRRLCLGCNQRFTTYERIERKPVVATINTESPNFEFNPETQSWRYQPSLTGLDLRGKKYKIILKQCSEQLTKLFDAIVKNNNKITRGDIVVISQQIGLPLKTTCEFLEHLDCLPTGTWELKFAGISVKDWIAMYAARES